MNLFAPPSPRSVLQITGADAKSFLQGMVTNDMDLLEQQPAIYAALLTPQGKVISTFFVIKNPKGGFWLDCPAGAFEILLKRLSMFRLRSDVVFMDISNSIQIALSSHKTDAISFADPRNQVLGWRNLINHTPLKSNFPNSRMTTMVPEQDLDFSSMEVFPSDINMDLQNGIAWKKGCYVGQEVVSRMRRRGTIRKRMALAVFEKKPPETGTAIYAGTAKIGTLCSNQDQQSLALIRTDRFHKACEQNAALLCGGQPLSLIPPNEQS